MEKHGRADWPNPLGPDLGDANRDSPAVERFKSSIESFSSDVEQEAKMNAKRRIMLQTLKFLSVSIIIAFERTIGLFKYNCNDKNVAIASLMFRAMYFNRTTNKRHNY